MKIYSRVYSVREATQGEKIIIIVGGIIVVVLLIAYAATRKNSTSQSTYIPRRPIIPHWPRVDYYSNEQSTNIINFTMKFKYHSSEDAKQLDKIAFDQKLHMPLDNDNVIKVIDDIIKYNKIANLSEQLMNFRHAIPDESKTRKNKIVLPMIIKCTEPLTEVLTEQAKIQDGIDIKNITTFFNTYVIASLAFGLDCNSLKNAGEELRTYKTENNSEVSKTDGALLLPKTTVHLFYPRRELIQRITQFLIDVVQRTIDYKDKNNVTSNDFVQMLIQIKSNGSDSDVNILDNEEGAENNNTIHINDLPVQVFIDYLGSFETSSTLLNSAIYELASHQDIQERMRKEILESIKKYGGITFDAVQGMEYLENFINKTLHKQSVLPQLLRYCKTDDKVPDTDAVFKSEAPIKVHMTIPKFYPSEDDTNNLSEEAVLPEIPRNCFALRYGRLQAKVGVITVLKDFKITLNKKTVNPVEYRPFQNVYGGFYIALENIH